MKFEAKEVFRPAIMLCVICLVVTALLAGTNLMTKDIIAEQTLAAEEASRKVVLPDAESFEEKSISAQDGEVSYYEAISSNGETVGWVFVTSAKGYGGDVSVMTGINTDGYVNGVVILSQNETPGLGANATNESFRSQYQQAAPESGFSVIKSGTPTDGQISALTGATITSNAVTDAVNEAISVYQTVKEAL